MHIIKIDISMLKWNANLYINSAPENVTSEDLLSNGHFQNFCEYDNSPSHDMNITGSCEFRIRPNVNQTQTLSEIPSPDQSEPLPPFDKWVTKYIRQTSQNNCQNQYQTSFSVRYVDQCQYAMIDDSHSMCRKGKRGNHYL